MSDDSIGIYELFHIPKAVSTLKFDVCIYHADCIDGFTAAWAVHLANPGIELVKGIYGQLPPKYQDKKIIIVDFSYSRQILENMANNNLVVVLDHHASAMERLQGLPTTGGDVLRLSLNLETTIDAGLYVDFDMTRSGARMAWEFFHANVISIPKLIEYVEDRDLWEFKWGNLTKYFHEYICNYDMTLEEWSNLAYMIETEHLYCHNIGEVLYNNKMKQINKIISASARIIKFDDMYVPIANIPYTMASEAGHIMCANNLMSITYYDRNDGKRIYSLRSPDNTDFNVANIAERYGGGGHVKSAGFIVDPNNDPILGTGMYKC